MSTRVIRSSKVRLMVTGRLNIRWTFLTIKSYTDWLYLWQAPTPRLPSKLWPKDDCSVGIAMNAIIGPPRPRTAMPRLGSGQVAQSHIHITRHGPGQEVVLDLQIHRLWIPDINLYDLKYSELPTWTWQCWYPIRSTGGWGRRLRPYQSFVPRLCSGFAHKMSSGR